MEAKMNKKLLNLLYISALLAFSSCGPARNPGSRSDAEAPPVSSRPPATPTESETDILTNIELRSQIHRTRGSLQISYEDERKLLAKDELPTTVHHTPIPYVDMDKTVITAPLPDLDCGLAISSIKDRITDCKNKNPSSSKWHGKTNGISGEGDWQLVVKSQKHILWQDLTTGLIWSDQLESTYSWNESSGNDSQNSACSTSFNQDALGNISAEEIKWRLPTRNDFLMADINGARFVLPNLDAKYWTASANDESHFWIIHQQSGTLSLAEVRDTSNIENSHLVRCIGTALK